LVRFGLLQRAQNRWHKAQTLALAITRFRKQVRFRRVSGHSRALPIAIRN
jgi:hypothetical protein